MYTYLLGWTKLNKYYYGVRYAKNAKPEDLWVTYFTSSKYVKEFRMKYGEPNIIQIRKVFSEKKKAMLWEQKVLKKMNAVFDEKWLNKTDNIAIDYHSMKHNTIPGMLAAKAKIKGKKYEEIYDESTCKKLKIKSSIVSNNNWKNKELRERMSKKPADISKYREAALKRWANKEQRDKMCASMRGVSKNPKGV